MENSRWRLWAAALVACLAVGAPADAAVVRTSFGVHATVVATCRIVPGNPCAPAAGQPPATVTEKPVVTMSHDPTTGAVIQTIEF